MIRERVRQAIAALWTADRHSGTHEAMLKRALKLQNYFTQPFFVAEPYTKRPGATVTAKEALRACREILDGRYDDLPADAICGNQREYRACNAVRPGHHLNSGR